MREIFVREVDTGGPDFGPGMIHPSHQGLPFQLHEFVSDESQESVPGSEDGNPLVQEATGCDADGGVHARCVGSTGEDDHGPVIRSLLAWGDAAQSLQQFQGVLETLTSQILGRREIAVLDLPGHGPALFDDFQQRRRHDTVSDESEHMTKGRFGVFQKQVHGGHPEACGENPVERRGGPAALHVPEHGHPHIDVEPLAQDFLDIGRADVKSIRMPGPLGHDDHLVGTPRLAGALDRRNHLLVPSQLQFLLGNENPRHSTGQTRGQGQITAMPAHGFHHESPLVGSGGGGEVVDGSSDVVQGRVGPDAHVRAKEIVVYGTRQSHHMQGGNRHPAIRLRALSQDRCGVVGPFAAQNMSPHKTSVAADDDQSLDAELEHVLHGRPSALAGAEKFGSSRAEKRTPLGQNAADVVPCEGAKGRPTGYEPLVSTVDSDDGNTSVDGPPHHRSHGGVHAGRIASTGHYRQSFDHQTLLELLELVDVETVTIHEKFPRLATVPRISA